MSGNITVSMSVAPAASFAFASPIGYRTHMMVFGPGGYRFADFLQVGIPLNLLLWIVGEDGEDLHQAA